MRRFAVRRFLALALLAVLWVSIAAPTTIDRFYAVVQITQNLSTMHNNMRANVQVIQASQAAGTITLVQAQQAFRDLGRAFNQRLTMNQTIMDAFPSQLAAGATAVGIAPSDVTADQSLLVTWATNLQNATFATVGDLNTLVSNVLANVPAAMLPF